jgi:hypothetical protein
VDEGHHGHARAREPLDGGVGGGGESGLIGDGEDGGQGGAIVAAQLGRRPRLQPGMPGTAAEESGRRLRIFACVRQHDEAKASFRVAADGLEVQLADRTPDVRQLEDVRHGHSLISMIAGPAAPFAILAPTT